MSLADMALRSIIRQAAATDPAQYSYGYLRGQIDVMSTYFEPDAELVREAHEAVNALRTNATNATT